MKWRLVAGVSLGVMAQLSASGLLLTSAWLIVRAAEHPPVMYLMVAIVSVRFFGVGRAVFRYGERLLTHDVALGRMTEDRVRAYQHLDRAAPGELHLQRRGDLVSRVVSDVDRSQDRLLRLQLPWIGTAVTAIAVVTLLAFISSTAALIVAAHVLACTVAARIGISRLARPSDENDASAQSVMAAETSMLAHASRDIVAYGAAGTFSREIRGSIAQRALAQRSTAWLEGLGVAWVLLSTGAATAAIGWSASAEPVMAGVLLLAPVALLEPLTGLIDAERNRGAVEEARRRLARLAELPESVTDPRRPLLLPVASDLTVTDLVVGWSHPLNAPVSFEVRPGTLVGISGPSGIGKTTIAHALTRLAAPLSGSIEMGGVDYEELDGRDIRRRVGLAGQDDVMFDTSIRENLRIARPRADDDQIWDALTRAGLAAFVRDLPQALDTVIGEGGCRISGGERQRLGIARLLLTDCPILILDEPTEHLDQAAAARILQDVLRLKESRGVVIISHADNVLDLCDTVIHVQRPQRLVSELASV